MKKKTVKKITRSIASFIKKTVQFLFFLIIVIVAGLWFSKHSFITIDTMEVDKYYDLLKNNTQPAHALTLSLGLEEDDHVQAELTRVGMKATDNLVVALDRLRSAMDLEQYPIGLVYGDQDKPPAFIENVNGEYMTITMSKKIKLRREQLNMLVHELSHVSVWSLDKSVSMNEGHEKVADHSILAGCDKEKVVDCSGFFRGQGIITLNGLTDDFSMIPGEGYSTEKKLFGYLKPEQFGYLLARYCAEHGISPYAIEPFLEPAGRKYFNIGREYLKRSAPHAIKQEGGATGIYWCPKCGQRITVDLSGESPDIKCTQCSFYLKTQNWWSPVAKLMRDGFAQVTHPN